MYANVSDEIVDLVASVIKHVVCPLRRHLILNCAL